MIVYHGSNVIVETPVLLTPKRTLDFGTGYYTRIKRISSYSTSDCLSLGTNGCKRDEYF